MNVFEIHIFQHGSPIRRWRAFHWTCIPTKPCFIYGFTQALSGSTQSTERSPAPSSAWPGAWATCSWPCWPTVCGTGGTSYWWSRRHAWRPSSLGGEIRPLPSARDAKSETVIGIMSGMPCMAILTPLTCRWIPESARWLLANGKVEEAKKYLEQCAKMNGKHSAKLDSEVKTSWIWAWHNSQCLCCFLWNGSCLFTVQTLSKVTVTEAANKDYTYLDLLKTQKMRKITICSGIFWYIFSDCRGVVNDIP